MPNNQVRKPLNEIRKKWKKHLADNDIDCFDFKQTLVSCDNTIDFETFALQFLLTKHKRRKNLPKYQP